MLLPNIIPGPLNMHRDASGSPVFGPDPSKLVYTLVLTAGVADSFQLPAQKGFYNVLASCEKGGDYYISWGQGTPTVPLVSGVSTVALNDSVRTCPENMIIECITSNASLKVTFSVWLSLAP